MYVFFVVFDFQFVVHSNLGKVVKEVVEEFRRNPPVPLPPSSTARYVFCSISVQVQCYIDFILHQNAAHKINTHKN